MKMKRSEAIDNGEQFSKGCRKHGIKLAMIDFEIVESLVKTAKQVEEVVGKIDEEIEYFEKRLENEKDEHNRKLKKLALTLYQGMLKLLTEKEEE